MTQKWFLILVLFLCILITACSKPYNKPVISPLGSQFYGVNFLLEQSKAVSLITIHGMCNHGEGWFKKNVDNFAKMLKMARVQGSNTHVYSGGTFGVKAYKTQLSRNDEVLAVYGIVYSAVTFPEKQMKLCPDVSHETDVCPESIITYDRKRANLNGKLKSKLLNDCLADAVIYLGPKGDEIREGVGIALQKIFEDMRDHPELADGQIAFLSESLGSKVLGDSLVCSAPEISRSIAFDLGRTSTLFLGANQIPLLNLAIDKPICDTKPTIKTLKSLGLDQKNLSTESFGIEGLVDLIESARTFKQNNMYPFKIVSFTDPNDLLSYEVSPDHFKGQDVEVINVNVSNATTYFGTIADPLKSHTGYRENDDVIQLIVKGTSF